MSLTKLYYTISNKQSIDVYVGQNYYGDKLQQYVKSSNNCRLFVFIDSNVYILHQKTIQQELITILGENIIIKIMPCGEQMKDVNYWFEGIDFLLKHNIQKSDMIVGIGGGVLGDVIGFIAATIRRGISLIHIPTTLLSMVDSSIGGKTGINYKVSKNTIGVVYHPKAVIIDVHFLSTLPKLEWYNGLGEIIKYGLIAHPDIFTYLDKISMVSSSWRESQLKTLIETCINIKMRICEQDPNESNTRHYLNYGHTYGHAIEHVSNYEIPHGAAVYIGSMVALFLSQYYNGDIKPNYILKYAKYYDPFIDYVKSKCNISDVFNVMKQDKKVYQGELRFVLLKKMGEPYLQYVRQYEWIVKSWEKMLLAFK